MSTESDNPASTIDQLTTCPNCCFLDQTAYYNLKNAQGITAEFVTDPEKAMLIYPISGPAVLSALVSLIVHDTIVMDEALSSWEKESIDYPYWVDEFPDAMLVSPPNELVDTVTAHFKERIPLPADLDPESFNMDERGYGMYAYLDERFASVGSEASQFNPVEDAWLLYNYRSALINHGIAVGMSAAIGMPIHSSEDRKHLFGHLSDRFDSASTPQGNMHDAVVNSVSQHVFSELPRSIIDSSTSHPILEELILKHAIKNRMPLFDSAIQIRESDEAVAYRKWLGDLQNETLRKTHASALRVEKAMREVAAVADEWGKRGSTDYGVKYKVRNFSLRGVPVVGDLIEKFTVLDPCIFGRKSHLNFIASWYKD
jgi:hypothetical protein